MIRLLSVMGLLLVSCCAQAQVPDFIAVRKKNGITVKSYYAGTDISFISKEGRRYDGRVDRVANDSIFLKYYQTNAYTNVFGTLSYDTVNTYIVPVHYQDIKQVLIPREMKKSHYLNTVGKLAFYGGYGYTLLNIVNSGNGYKPFARDNLANTAVGLGIGTLGLILNRRYRKGYQRSGKYRIVYMDLDTPPAN
ncbi:hypothetical protein GCM10027051_00390 [Niabella terrae]